MFQKLSKYVFEKLEAYNKRVQKYFDQHPNQKKIFDWLLNNNPLSGGYDTLTGVAFCLVMVVLIWIIKNVFF